jgi:hypothetical protein
MMEVAVSAVVASCCIAFWIPQTFGTLGHQRAARSPWATSACFCAAMAALFIPIQGTPILYFLRGVLGDFSLTTLIWAMLAFSGQLRGKALLPPDERWIILLAFALTAALFYPAALGLTCTDPYAWGYFTTPFLVGLGLVCCMALVFRLYWAVFILCAGLVVATLEIFPSANAWDYLMDPAFAIYAILASTVEIVRRRRKDQQPLSTF